MNIILNDFQVDTAIARLMSRPDWPGKRVEDAWLSRFPVHPEAECKRLPFVDFCGVERAIRENARLRKPELAVLNGAQNADFPPGDFDPAAGYLIGFTDYADAAICVDLRPDRDPRIIYDCLAPRIIYDCLAPRIIFATAFQSISEFVQFYVAQHGE